MSVKIFDEVGLANSFKNVLQVAQRGSVVIKTFASYYNDNNEVCLFTIYTIGASIKDVIIQEEGLLIVDIYNFLLIS